jgi:predicted naringenin-chalcone synthase
MVKLLSIGTALQPDFLSQAQAFEHARYISCKSENEERVLQRLYKRTSIASRSIICAIDNFYPRSSTVASQPGTAARMARYKEEVRPLATAAAQRALAQAAIPASMIANLVTVSCTGFFAPGFDTEIIEALDLSRGTSRTHIGFMGCHGALNGLRVGSALAKGSGSSSLVVAAEICSLHFQYGSKRDDLMANALFADGAAACVLSDSWAPAPGANEAVGHYSLAASASYLVPDSSQAMTWQIGDHGFSMTLSAAVPFLIEKHLGPWLNQWLDKLNLDLSQIGAWAVHPGGPRILDAVEKALGLDSVALDLSREIFGSLGNMSSPTILFILDRLATASAPAPVVALAFGPGLTIEAAIFKTSTSK